MKLSGRLLAISHKVTPAAGLADIGTDHGKLPVYLIVKGIIPFAIASDNRIASLGKARVLVKKCNLESKIDLRLGSGLAVLRSGEANQIVVAGMGGPLIAEIINCTQARTCGKLILQPMQYPAYLSRWLCVNGFDIMDEDLVEDGGRIYRIFVCRAGSPQKIRDEVFNDVGEKLIEKKDPLLGKYTYQIIKRYRYIYNSTTDIRAKAKLKDKIYKLEGILNEYKSTDNI